MENNTEKKKQYLQDEIGDEYKTWRFPSYVKIQAPTGCGKSYFILRVLLVYARKNDRNILYLVNRKALKRQIEEEIKKVFYEMDWGVFWNGRENNCIKVVTYQEIESKLKSGVRDPLKQNYNYVVYDECHYFYSDSDFNPATEMSFEYLLNRVADRYTAHIFMSATMGKIEKILDKKMIQIGKRENENTKVPFWCPRFPYKIPNDYSYVKLHSFDDGEDLPNIIHEHKKDNEKWLIFIDSIKMGKDTKEKLIENETFKSNDIVVLSSGYEDDENAEQSMQDLSERQMICKPVIIATSVIDNGISFKDMSLRNIVIMADTEEEFIQMLGRKRRDEEEINVYLCKRNTAYFTGRRKYVKNVLEAVQFCQSEIGNYLQWQQKILNRILSEEKFYNSTRKFLYCMNGVLGLSNISIQKLQDLINFYSKMEIAMQNNDKSFLFEQMSWMGLPENEIENVIGEMEADEYERNKKKMEDNLKGLLGENTENSLTREENMKILKQDEFKDLWIYFGKRVPLDADKIKGLKKKDRAVQPEEFNNCMEAAGLQYRMKKEKGKFIIQEISDDITAES